MANQHAIRRETAEGEPQKPKKTASMEGLAGPADGSASLPANDNANMPPLPACLPVTDDEVTLLHQYLSREILGLFS